MALLFIDGCENDVVTSKWTSSNGTVTFLPTDGVVTNTGAISFPAGAFGTNQLVKIIKNTKVGNFTDNENVLTRTSFWFKCSETITTEAPFMQWREYYYRDNAVVSIGTNGKLRVSNWYPSTDVARRVYYDVSNMVRIDDNQWHFLEFAQFYSGTSAGLIEVYVDNLLALKRTGSNLSAAPINAPSLMGQFLIGGLVNGTMYIDDLVIWDESNYPDVYKGKKGPVNIYTIRPSADLWANSAPSSGSDRFSLINENQTSLANSVSLGLNRTDLYEFSNMPEIGIPGQIYAVSPSIVYTSVSDGYRSNLKIVMTADENTFLEGNTFSALSKTVANGYTYTSTFVTDSWSANTVNSFKIGFKVVE